MNSNNPMKEFFEKLGQQTVQSPSAFWYEVQPGVLLSFPYYKLITPPQEELNELFKKYHLKAIRYPTPLESFGFYSYLQVNTNFDFNLDSLEKETRRQTRRGLEKCIVKQIDFDFLAEHGLALNRETAERQNRQTIYTNEKYWNNYCRQANQVEGLVVWAALVDDKLGSYIIVAEIDEWANCLLTHSSQELLKYRASNALLYEVSSYYLKKKCKICYGLGSLENVEKLDHFKINMGFEFKRIKQRLMFSKKIHMLTLLAQEPCLKMLEYGFPQNYTVRKSAAMIRLYRQQTTEVPKTMEQQDKDGK